VKLTSVISVIAILIMTSALPAQAASTWAIVVHGGAGVIERKDLSPEQETAYRAAMNRAIQAGAAVLTKGGSALDAIETTIKLMEDDPLFNAGRGAVFTAEGRNELDAAIMDGKTLAAGSIAGVTRTRHPISLARRVMEKSPHVMLISTGADTFSKEQGLEQVEPGWFYTERRWRALEKFLKEKNLSIPPKPAGVRDAGTTASLAHDEGKKGTVGVVALDLNGNIAVGTSTGGTTGKRWGRVGDSPIIGAGTYASNTSCAVSATGTGEYFIRLTVAREICLLVEHKGMKLQAAADEVVQKRLSAIGGDGGVIAVAPDGQMAWSFNTSGMYRARMAKDQPVLISIYKDEK
jgi:L-asparaginase / beta-aspartyl-peptidase